MSPTDRPFDELSTGAQVHRLRQVAFAALAEYPIVVSSVKLLLHAYNTSFRVDTADGRRFSLRINVGNPKSAASMAAELAWMSAISQDTEVVVPAPIATRSGDLSTKVWCESLGRELWVVMMSWLPGRDLDEPTPAACRALGRATAQLHDHATSWRLPAGAALPSMAKVLLEDPDRFVEEHPLLTDERRGVFGAAMEQVQAQYDVVFAAGPVHPIHADLHGGNVKWLRGRLSVFDFDDAAMGVPVHDLGITTYYLRDDPELEAALLDGYAEIRPLPDLTAAQFEAIVASRILLILNDVLYLANADIQALAPRYVANAAVKLRAYLDTGVFCHKVEGLIPIDG